MLKYLVLTFLAFSFPSLGQKDPCLSSDLKYKKLLSKAISQENYENQTKKLSALISKYPNYAETYFTYARLTMRESEIKSTNEQTFQKSRELKKTAILYYNFTINKCPKYQAECYYTIGSSLIEDGDYKNGTTYFKKFIEFKEDDFQSIPKDFDKKKKEVNDFINRIEFEDELISKPVPFSPIKKQNVSSNLDEYFPMISPDNELLFFTRKVDRTNLGDIGKNILEEFTISTFNKENNEFNYGTPLNKPFNDGYFKNYGSATLSLDNKEMIICACRDEKVYNKIYLNCDLYSTIFKQTGKGGNDFQWTTLVNLGPNINTSDGWEAQPSLSADGKELFFTSVRNGSRDNDIYYSQRQVDGSWSSAIPFDIINTVGKDKSPFFHQDGKTLYFVSSNSNERKGLGGLDIFYIRKQGDNWSEPKNIGFPINSENDELGLIISTDGKTAYFSSTNEGNWDIYGFDLYQEARPQEIILVKGQLLDENGNGIKNATVTINYNESGTSNTFQVNGDDGKYTAVIEVSDKEDITISVNKEGFAYNGLVIEKDELETNKSTVLQLGNLKMDTLLEGKAYNLSDIFFESESYELNKKSLALLLGFSNYLLQNTKISIAINGHTDDIGEDDKNLLLSQNRADAVRNYLIDKGINASRLKSIGYGEKKPSVPNLNELNRAKNRRTEFEILEIKK
jgi:outer membrane protein OmpA-like peptidoglycan-associated protein